MLFFTFIIVRVVNLEAFEARKPAMSTAVVLDP
jgi:hypothetical protein